jgi:hypothetical protein
MSNLRAWMWLSLHVLRAGQLASRYLDREGNIQMFLLLALILVVLWAGGFFVMHISSFFIHLLLIFAVISLVAHLITGRKSS